MKTQKNFGIAVIMAFMVISSCQDPAGPDKTEPPEPPGPPVVFPEVTSVPMKLWYNKPGTDWMKHALPIGNGTLGGMFYGGVESEQIQFNEKTLWEGGPSSRGAYQNFGSLYIEFPHKFESVKDYQRELSLDTAIGSVSYKVGDVSYLREYFVSYPDKVIVMRFTNDSPPDEKESLNMTLYLNSAHSRPRDINIEDKSVSFSGKLELVNYEARLVILNEGGSIEQVTNSGVKISGADAVTMLLIGGTNYSIESPSYIGETADALHSRLVATTNSAAAKSYTVLKQNHLNDYQPLFKRVKLDLNNAQVPNVPTNELLVYPAKEDPYLPMLYFQYGRYLMISSSRGMNLPNNLQGIWNHRNNPPWESDIHTNINIQMNYWPAEVANLSECHLPFLNYIAIEALRPGGGFQKVASETGNPGWALKTENNIFAHQNWEPNRPANAWYCMHLWQHYAYTNNKAFLEQTAFPVMKSACEFWLDRLILDTADNKWVAPREWSPEHGPWEDGVSYAQQLIWELFDNTIKAADILGKNDDAIIKQVKEKFKVLDNGVAEGSWGQLREWKKTNDDQNDKHRHVSHLIALYPGNQISYRAAEPKYADAAKKSLEARGDAGTGWSLAWKIGLWARLFDGDHAYKILSRALKRTEVTTNQGREDDGGVYDNLLDAHPPFQIDGNFGAAAGIAEMLLQSNQGFLHLLPALPSTWPSGTVVGLRAEGDFTVYIRWANSKLVSCMVYSGSGNDFTVYYDGKESSKFSTTPGGTYTVNF